jgi:hypothetical protein
VNYYRGRTLEVGALVEEFADRVTSVGKIVVLVRFIMVGQEVVIEKDRVVSAAGQQFFCLLDSGRDLKVVASKSLLEPAVPPFSITLIGVRSALRSASFSLIRMLRIKPITVNEELRIQNGESLISRFHSLFSVLNSQFSILIFPML